jgi:hypothetical protein
MINIDLNKLISPVAVAKLRSAGLHKVAAALAKTEGFKTAEEINMADAVTILGAKIRYKNASYARIKEGLDALALIDTK